MVGRSLADARALNDGVNERAHAAPRGEAGVSRSEKNAYGGDVRGLHLQGGARSRAIWIWQIGVVVFESKDTLG